MDQLKDVILSTLAEIQESVPEEKKEPQETKMESSTPLQSSMVDAEESSTTKESFFEEVTKKSTPQSDNAASIENELLFLHSLRERFLVLFEGFQAPNNSALEAKIDLTLNFLEYVLSTIDVRIEKLKGK